MDKTFETKDGQQMLYDGAVEPKDENTDDKLKEAIESQLSKIRRQSMLLGMQVCCHTVLDKIVTAMKKPGKRTMKDYKRLVKDIEQFCQIGVSRKINADGEADPIDTDNSTKLTEETNETVSN